MRRLIPAAELFALDMPGEQILQLGAYEPVSSSQMAAFRAGIAYGSNPDHGPIEGHADDMLQAYPEHFEMGANAGELLVASSGVHLEGVAA